MIKPLKPLLLTISLCCASQATAQLSAPPITSALPNVSSITAGNAAGVLQYCLKNNLVSSTSAGAVLDGLGKKSELTKSTDYTSGETGNILTGRGTSTSIAGLQPFLQSQACNMVLEQAKHLSG